MTEKIDAVIGTGSDEEARAVATRMREIEHRVAQLLPPSTEPLRPFTDVEARPLSANDGQEVLALREEYARLQQRLGMLAAGK